MGRRIRKEIGQGCTGQEREEKNMFWHIYEISLYFLHYIEFEDIFLEQEEESAG